MKTELNKWKNLSPFKKNKQNPFLYRRDLQLLIAGKFDGRYELDPAPRRSIFFQKNSKNRNIEYYHLRCKAHGISFILTAQSFKTSIKFLKKCRECTANHNKDIAPVLSWEDHNNKLRNSHSEYIRKYHFVLEIPGFSKIKPKSLKIKCTYHKVIFFQDQGLLGKNHGCKQCRSLASKRKYTDEDLKVIVNEQLENHETGLSDLYSYQSHKIDKYKHYSIIFLCNGDGHKYPHPFKYSKSNIHSKMCPRCFPKGSISRGERVVREILNEKHISFEINKTFQNLRFKQKLHVDFYIKSLNLFIEFDGQQHFKMHGYEVDNKEHLKRIKRDIIKNKYCQENKINLLRIPYRFLKDKDSMISMINSAIKSIESGNKEIIHISLNQEVKDFYNDFYNSNNSNC